MRKVFIYLYPIEPFYKIFTHDTDFYTEMGREEPFKVLNNCIDIRYRKKNYEIIFVKYPDTKIFGINMQENDKVFNTDVTFEEATVHNDSDFFIEPSNAYLLEQIGKIEEVVVGGFHFSYCVKHFAEYTYSKGIKTLVDLDLTDLFFNHYYLTEYFNITSYDPKRFQEYWMHYYGNLHTLESCTKQFAFFYGSPVYGMNIKESKFNSKL